MAMAQKGKSILKTNEKAEVRDLVEATINYPDKKQRHPYSLTRRVYEWNFGYVVGFDGFHGCTCKHMQVIYDFKQRIVITAFPIV